MSTHTHRHAIPEEVLALSHERDLLRKRGQYDRADVLKQRIEDAGFLVKDNPHGAHLVILPGVEVDSELYPIARQLPSLLNDPDTCTFSVNVLARDSFEQTRRCIESVLRFAGDSNIEILLVDNASRDGIGQWAEEARQQEPRLHYLRATRKMGAAEARNLGLKRSQGRYILILDTSVELTGDIFSPLAKTMEDSEIGITGLHGLVTSDLRHFEPIEGEGSAEPQEVDAVDALCLVFRRAALKTVGLFDERYRHPYYMDVDLSFAIRDQGVKAVLTPDLPLTLHPPVTDPALSDVERARLAKRNFYRYLGKWGTREDMLPEE